MHRICCYLLLPALALAIVPAPAVAQTFLGKGPLQWSEKLISADARERRSAAYALGKLGPFAQNNVDLLLNALRNDKDNSVKEAAAYAIGEICQVSAEVRATKLDLLLPILKKALTDEKDELVRRSAAYALGSLRKDAAAALTDLDGALRDKSPAVRQNVAWALGEIGPAAVLSLRKAMGDADPYVLRDAAGSLAKVGSAARPAMPELLAKVDHPDIEVKKAVMLALVPIVNKKDGAAIAQPLLKVVNNQRENPEVRLNAALALGNIGGDAMRVEAVLDDGTVFESWQMKTTGQPVTLKAAPAVVPEPAS